MALSLDENQKRIVDTKKKLPSDRPKYYSATQSKMVTISEDFEAFLILQGRPRNEDTVKWLKEATKFSSRDSDRDALAALALQKDADDAKASSNELFPIIDLFKRFREGYNMDGFQNVTEAGALLNDIQKMMLEFNHLVSRLKHRQIYAGVALTDLKNKGITPEQQRQINSWFAPLTAY